MKFANDTNNGLSEAHLNSGAQQKFRLNADYNGSEVIQRKLFGQNIQEAPQLTKAEAEQQQKRRAEQVEEANKIRGAMIKQEERQVGSVPFSIYRMYLSSGGCFLTFVMFTSYIISQAIKLGCDWWLGIWSDRTYGLTTGQYIGIYAGLAGGITVFYFLRGVLFGIFTLKVANKLQKRLLMSVLRCPM